MSLKQINLSKFQFYQKLVIFSILFRENKSPFSTNSQMCRPAFGDLKYREQKKQQKRKYRRHDSQL